MSDSIVKLLLEEHQPSFLDAIDRSAGARLGTNELQSLEGAVRTHLATALRRAYEMGYREALAARAKAEAAKSTVGVLVEDTLGSMVAPPPRPPSGEEPPDEGARKVIEEMRALVTQVGEAMKQAEPHKATNAELSLFGEALPDEPEDDDEDTVALEAQALEVATADDDEDAATDEPDPQIAVALEEIEGDEGDEEEPGAEAQADKPRIRRSNAELAAIAERVFEYIKEHPGTKARPARDALGLEGPDWNLATRRLSKARRIFYGGPLNARMYFAVEETKRGRPKKLSKSAFILAFPFDLPAAEVVEAARKMGLEIDERYVHTIRSAERRRLRKEAAEARARAIAERIDAVFARPRDPDVYRELRRAFTQARRTDGIWTACQALVTLGAAEDSEQAFYETRRSDTAAHAHAALTPELRARHAVHPGADPRVTLVIDYLLPALLERYGRPTASLGYTEVHRVDPSRFSVLSQNLVYASRVLGVELPPIYQHGTAPVAIFCIHGDVPTLGLGGAAAPFTDVRDLAFVAAHHVSYFLPGHYVRRLVPQEPELRRWVEAALALSRGATHFEHLSPLEQSMLTTQVDPDERKIIVRETEGLDAKDIDLEGWFRAVDATADRLGLLLCHDLERALLLLRGGEGTGDEATEARVDALRTWSVSEDYLALRAALGIAGE